MSLILIGSLGLINIPAHAADVSSDQIQDISDQIAERKIKLEQLDSKIDKYSDLIQEQRNLKNTLSNDLSLIENNLARNELDLEQTEIEIENVQDEIKLLDLQMAENEKDLADQKILIASLLRKIRDTGNTGLVEMVFSHRNFADLFDDLNRLESINKNLKTALAETKQTKDILDKNRAGKEEKLISLTSLQEDLEKKEYALEESQSAKTLLVIKAQKSEFEYQALLSELRQEQQYLDSQVLSMQRRLESKLSESDVLGDSSLLSWPVSDYRITVFFHDPTYPFIHLFQHSGLDLAVPTGTPVRSVAPGYVAFARTGQMYGNYIMVIHANGLATLYAHLSSMNVVADQFVSRGDVIGYSGNTGFSTGPHLHFEVRSNGVPVDPLGYLISL